MCLWEEGRIDEGKEERKDGWKEGGSVGERTI